LYMGEMVVLNCGKIMQLPTNLLENGEQG
jgi:hypothetical protein